MNWVKTERLFSLKTPYDFRVVLLNPDATNWEENHPSIFGLYLGILCGGNAQQLFWAHSPEQPWATVQGLTVRDACVSGDVLWACRLAIVSLEEIARRRV